MAKTTINVTEEQIAAGKRNSVTKNPVATSIKAATGKSVSTAQINEVGTVTLGYRSQSLRTFSRVPKKVVAALNAYNKTGKMKPFSFGLQTA